MSHLARWPVLLLVLCLASPAPAQDEEEGEAYDQESAEGEEPGFSVNGLLKLQSGVFLPLLSDGFSPQENEAWIKDSNGNLLEPCDPVLIPQKPCYPINHGQEPGSLSMLRATLQLEADWQVTSKIALHGILRGVRSLETDADGWAQMPRPSTSTSGEQRRAEARNFVQSNYYTEADLRELYLDVDVNDRLSFRLGRQQVTWGDTGQYRLLDVINPADNTWHFGPLESFEDSRIPLWIAKGLIEFPSIDHSLELVWMPGIDRPEDMVTVPLTLVGAWGLPLSNTPSPYVIDEKVFLYPKNSIQDTMRAGFRWKGSIGNAMSYSLVYYYTHQLSPPIPLYYDRVKLPDGSYDNNHLERLYLGFPRQHITGFSLEYTLESPIGTVLRLETSFEPDRTFPRTSTTARTHQDPNMASRVYFEPPKMLAVSYALVAMRPTMIRFLNPTQNFLLVLQFMHTMVPGMSATDQTDLVDIPGYNDMKARKHDLRLIFAASTNYLHGFISPKVIVVYVLPDFDRPDVSPMGSGFVTAGVNFRFGTHWRVDLSLTDFFGDDPYQGLGLFRDRDEINLAVTCQF